jgi:hypothetical protein
MEKPPLHPSRTRILGVSFALFFLLFFSNVLSSVKIKNPVVDASLLSLCQSLKTPAGPPSDFHRRVQSDRFVPGTKPTLIKNAKIWTGQDNGMHVIQGDILLDQGMITEVGRVSPKKHKDISVLDAHGAWVTPGIVDIHSHLGVYSAPSLLGAEDGNSIKGTIGAWMRALDGLNTHDDSYNYSISGGVTTSLILPGSANAIGEYSTLRTIIQL